MQPSTINTPEKTSDAPKPTLKQRVLSQFKEVFGMFVYLWLLFALFTYHKAIVLAQYNIAYEPFGVAFINAFILAKVMLVAEKMNLAAKLRNKPLAYPILTKSVVLAVIFILFNVVETMIKGLWQGKALSDSLPKIGGGSPAEFIVTGLILAVALIPFFAFRELSRALGKGVLDGLLLRKRQKTSGPVQ